MTIWQIDNIMSFARQMAKYSPTNKRKIQVKYQGLFVSIFLEFGGNVMCFCWGERNILSLQWIFGQNSHHTSRLQCIPMYFYGCYNHPIFTPREEWCIGANMHHSGQYCGATKVGIMYYIFCKCAKLQQCYHNYSAYRILWLPRDTAKKWSQSDNCHREIVIISDKHCIVVHLQFNFVCHLAGLGVPSMQEMKRFITPLSNCLPPPRPEARGGQEGEHASRPTDIDCELTSDKWDVLDTFKVYVFFPRSPLTPYDKLIDIQGLDMKIVTSPFSVKLVCHRLSR